MTDELLLSPRPASMEKREGWFEIHMGTGVVIEPGASTSVQKSARSLTNAVSKLLDLKLQIVPIWDLARDGQIALAISSDREIPAEGYSLEVSSRHVSIVGADEAGLFYGIQTLIQIARSSGRRWPALSIADHPAVPTRGIMLDISRGRVPTLETVESLIRAFAHFKLNHLQLYTEHAFDFPSAPEIGHGTGAMTPDDILRLDLLCREHHIELAANFQSLGHQGRLLKLPSLQHLAETPWRFTFATGNDEVFTFIDQLYGDLLPCFSSKLLNINADEPWDLGRGVSRAMSEKAGYGGVYLHHIRRLHELATKHGRRLAMWADVLKHYPELIPELPKDILLIDWWYEVADRYESLDALANSGIEFWVCPSTSAWSAVYPRLDNAFRNIRDYVEQGLAAGATGVFISEWVDSGHIQPVTNSIYPFLWGAECAWSGATTPRDEFDAAFGLHVFSDRSGEIVAAIRRLGAAMQNHPNWLVNWNSAMALYEDPIAGKIAGVTSSEEIAEAHAAAVAIQPLLSQIPDPVWRADLAFLTWQILFACDKVETTRAIQALLESGMVSPSDVEHLDPAIANLRRLRDVLPAMLDELEHRWLAANRRSFLQASLDKFTALIAQLDRALAWLQRQRERIAEGLRIEPPAAYDTGGYAVMHEATYLWVKELEAIVGYDALPDDIKEYLRDVGGA